MNCLEFLENVAGQMAQHLRALAGLKRCEMAQFNFKSVGKTQSCYLS